MINTRLCSVRLSMPGGLCLYRAGASFYNAAGYTGQGCVGIALTHSTPATSYTASGFICCMHGCTCWEHTPRGWVPNLLLVDTKRDSRQLVKRRLSIVVDWVYKQLLVVPLLKNVPLATRAPFVDNNLKSTNSPCSLHVR